MNEAVQPPRPFSGPKCWALSASAGLAVGAALSLLFSVGVLKNGAPEIPAYFAAPFVLLLLSIALVPFINAKFWADHYPDFAFALGGVTVACYLVGLRSFTQDGRSYGPHRMLEVAREYFQFISLIGSLYVVSGGLLIDVRGRATPLINTGLLALGAVLANVFGTTGASVLLIRPYLRLNQNRLRPFHLVLFIFIVSNCGGVLTPIGDPPLFIGFLKGVPFEWTLFHCFPAWMLCIGLLLAVFFVLDSLAARKNRVARRKAETQIFIDQPDSAPTPEKGVKVALSGLSTLFFLFLVLFGVFFDRLIEDLLGVKTELPLGAVLQLAAAAAAYRCASRGNLEANRFSFLPIKEVALLFVGIFAAMVPALDYLRQHAEQLGMMTPTAFFWTAGALSSFLDNAPTYYTFLETAHGLADLEPGPDATRAWLALQAVGQTGYPAAKLLLAISLAAVFFGANTYIGNGPNFMIKAIGEEAGVPMPTFFGYLLKYSLPIMLPVLFLVWLVFVR